MPPSPAAPGERPITPPEHVLKNAWLCTLESGLHTADVYRPQLSTAQVDTEAFTAAVVERLGQEPRQLQPVHYQSGGITVPTTTTPRSQKRLVGIDVFLDWDEDGRAPAILGERLGLAAPAPGG